MNVLFFVQPGQNSRSTLLDLRAGFERAGHRTMVWELETQWKLRSQPAEQRLASAQALAELAAATMRSNAIGLCVGMWANAAASFSPIAVDGRTSSVFEAAGVPLLCYWLDAPMWAHQGEGLQFIESFSPVLRWRNCIHVINNPGTAEEMARVLGLPNVLALHYGINESTFRPHPEIEPEFDLVCSYGPGDPEPTAVMLEELERDDPNAGRIRQSEAQRVLPALKAHAERWPTGMRDQAVELLCVLLSVQLEHRDIPALARLIAIAEQRPDLAGAAEHAVSDAVLWADVSMCVRSIEQWERAFTFSFLSRGLRSATFGQGDPGPWRCRSTALGQMAWEDQAKAYARGHIGLNVMRWQDDVGLNVKPYEITASGAALLCGWRRGLEDLFEVGRECETFRTPSEALRKSLALLGDPARLRAMASAGRARTLRDYTWTNVARTILGTVFQAADSGETALERDRG